MQRSDAALVDHAFEVLRLVAIRGSLGLSVMTLGVHVFALHVVS